MRRLIVKLLQPAVVGAQRQACDDFRSARLRLGAASRPQLEASHRIWLASCCVLLKNAARNTSGRLIDEPQERLEELGAELSLAGDDGDLVFRLGRQRASLTPYRRVSVTPSTALRLVQEHLAPGFVVGDIIHPNAAEVLVQHGWSFWDRRGRLRRWLVDQDFRVDMNGLRSFVTGAPGPDPANPVVGSGAISVAVALLTAADPTTIGVREIARVTGMNLSTISRARSKLIDAALIEPDGSPLPNELFRATSRAWRPRTTPVDQAPSGDGWVLSADDAAAHHGAAVFSGRSRWYTTDQETQRRHALRHRNTEGYHEIALAPAPLVNATAVDGFVHPVIAALDLSTTSRGREILTTWTSPSISKPVWLRRHRRPACRSMR